MCGYKWITRTDSGLVTLLDLKSAYIFAYILNDTTCLAVTLDISTCLTV